MPSFDRIGRSRNLHEKCVKSIEDTILPGPYRSDESFSNETTIAEQLDVSRPVVREALKSLQSCGLLEVRRGTMGEVCARRSKKEILTERLKSLGTTSRTLWIG